MTLAKAAVLAGEYEKAGRLAEAESVCRQILAVYPEHPDTLHLFGSLLLRRGDALGALDALSRAGILVGDPVYDRHLGKALAAAGRSEEAVAALSRALGAGEDAGVLNDLGKALANLGRIEDAVDSFRRAVAAAPDFVSALANLGALLVSVDRCEDALEILYRAEKLGAGRADDVPYTIGKALHRSGRLEEAIPYFEAAIRQDPTDVRACNDLGATLTEIDRPNPAVKILKEAIKIDPGSAELYYNLGNAYARQRRVANALAAFERAIELNPDFAPAHFNRGVALLTLGDYSAGWPEYEWRWKTPAMSGSVRRLPIPQWCGEEIVGKTILVHAEQGLGDSIQFVRYVPWLAGKGARVVVECPRLLHRLFSGMKSIDRLVTSADADSEAARGAFDVHSPLMSLPRIHGTTTHNMPATGPYLVAEPELSRAWRDLPKGAFRAGLVWQGNPDHRRDRFRSVPLRVLRQALEVPGVVWISLQKDDYPGMTDGVPEALIPKSPRSASGGSIDDFSDTAAIIDNLDLVVSIDTSVAHLAGALGKPVWTMLPVDPDWRWLLDRDDSPWYPTMRLFRQRQPGDWDDVAGRLKMALENAVQEKKG